MFFNNQKIPIIGRRIGVVILVCVLSFLSGCSDTEPKSRSAFIIFLQTEIVNKNRINLPMLTASKVKDLGIYEQDYQILLDFNNEFRSLFTAFSETLPLIPSFTSTSEMLDNHDEIIKILNRIADTEKQLLQLIERSEQRKAELVRADDVKIVFDRAYAKVVTQQVEPFLGPLPLLKSVFVEAEALISFVVAQGSDANVEGNRVEFSDPKALQHFNEINSTLQEAQKAYLAFPQR